MRLTPVLWIACLLKSGPGYQVLRKIFLQQNTELAVVSHARTHARSRKPQTERNGSVYSPGRRRD